jgi:hypothetical protein
MISDNSRPAPLLPRAWPTRAKAAMLHIVSLAHLAIVHARGWAANSINVRVRQAAQIDELRAEVAMLSEEIRIKDARLAAIPPHRRPRYAPILRLAIIELAGESGDTILVSVSSTLVRAGIE